MIIRDAAHGDLEAIRSLYNALIPTTTVAWSEDLQSLDERVAWFDRLMAEGYVVLVAEVDGAVVGFAAYDSFRGAGRWPGYRYTVEHTIHVGEDQWGRGVGGALLDALIERATAAGLHVMVGAVDGANDTSIRFHRRLGFEVVGTMPEVGFKFGRWLDLVLMQRILSDDPPRPTDLAPD